MKKALITGITGQDGSYLAKHLLDLGYEVFGLMPRRSTKTTWRLEYLGILDKVKLIEGDLADMAACAAAVLESQPDEVYNLGAQSFVATSWHQPVLTAHATGLGALNMLEAIRRLKPDARFYIGWTDDALHVHLRAYEANPVADITERNGNVSQRYASKQLHIYFGFARYQSCHCRNIPLQAVICFGHWGQSSSFIRFLGAGASFARGAASAGAFFSVGREPVASADMLPFADTSPPTLICVLRMGDEAE